MSEYLKIILPAVIGLLGTLVAVYFGYRQWKRQHEAAQSGTFLTEKRAAYKQLWEKLEEVHIRLRTEEVSGSDFNALVLGVNSYILKNSLYLEDHDRDSANKYLQAVRRLKQVISDSQNEKAEEAMMTSMAIPDEVIDTAEQIKASVNEVEQIRNAMRERFRKILVSE